MTGLLERSAACEYLGLLLLSLLLLGELGGFEALLIRQELLVKLNQVLLRRV
jgi:hypothetical protein